MSNAQTKSTTLFSLTAVKQWFKVTNPNTNEDFRLSVAADSASEEIENETGRWFVKRTVTEIYDGDGSSKLFLEGRPASVISSLSIGGSVVASTSYVVNQSLGVIILTDGSIFTPGYQNISVSYTFGYDKQDGDLLPRDIYRAGLDLTKAIYDELATGAIAASTVSLGPNSMIVKAAKRPPSVQRVIDTWRDSRV